MNMIKDLQNQEYRQLFSEKVASLGFKGVLAFFCFHVIKMIIVVIPGGPLQVIAGAAFGTWGGLLILLLGCAAGTIIIYSIVHKFGQKLIVRFFGIEVIDTWDFLKDEKKTALAAFILFLIPGFPKDTLTYLVPLTKIPLLQFTAISLLARFPAILSSTIMGDAVIQGNWILFAVIFAATAIVGIAGIQFKDRIIKLFSVKSDTPCSHGLD